MLLSPNEWIRVESDRARRTLLRYYCLGYRLCEAGRSLILVRRIGKKKRRKKNSRTYTGAGGEIKTWHGKWRWYKGEVIIRGRKVGYFIRCPEAIVVKIVRCKRIPPPLARRDFTSRTDVPPPPRDNRSHTTSVRGCKPFHRANLAPSTTVICHSNGQNEGQRGF